MAAEQHNSPAPGVFEAVVNLTTYPFFVARSLEKIPPNGSGKCCYFFGGGFDPVVKFCMRSRRNLGMNSPNDQLIGIENPDLLGSCD